MWYDGVSTLINMDPVTATVLLFVLSVLAAYQMNVVPILVAKLARRRQWVYAFVP